MRNVYDEEIAHTDHWIGELITGVRERSGGEPLVVVVTADHGEQFDEQGFTGHGNDLCAENLRVPLIVWGDIEPELGGTRVTEPVENAAIAATLLELAGERPDWVRRRSLLAQTREGGVPCFSELHRRDGQVLYRSVVLDGWKLTREPLSGALELFELEADPQEDVDLAGSSSPRAVAALQRLTSELDRFALRVGPTRSSPGQAVKLEDFEIDRLRQLGYAE